MKSSAGACGITVYFCFVLLTATTARGAEYIFPQVADGSSGSLAYVTTFLINNVRSSSNTVTISFFQGGLSNPDNGQPWILDLRSNDRSDIAGRNSTLTFTLAGLETVNVLTAGTGPMLTGWAKIQTTTPLDVSEIFSALRPDLSPQKLNWEAGVLSNPAAPRFSFEANFSADDTITGTTVNTGYAIVNPNADPVDLTATLYSRTGAQVGQPKVITLPANGQLAEFVNQRFSDVQLPPSFHGTMRLSAELNVAMCALRWSYGAASDVFSALAVNPDFTLGYNPYNDREPSTVPANALPILLPAEITGSKNVPDTNADGDWYAVDLTAGQTLFVVLVADLMGSPYDGDIIVRDASGNQLKREDDWASGTGDATLDYKVVTTGTYYINLMSRTGTGTSGGAYKLYVNARSVASVGASSVAN
jgi:hypothetical protein